MKIKCICNAEVIVNDMPFVNNTVIKVFHCRFKEENGDYLYVDPRLSINLNCLECLAWQKTQPKFNELNHNK